MRGFTRRNNLKKVIIPDSVTTIGAGAFSDCSSLTSVIIGNGVMTIGEEAFYGCGSLTDVYYTGTEEEWAAVSIGASNDSFKNATVHYSSATN